MPVIAAAAIGAGGALLSSRAQSKASDRAAQASQQAADQATAEQRRQFDIAQQNQAPWLATGTSALNQLASLYGLQTAQSPSTFNESAYLAANPDVAAAVGRGDFGGSALAHYNQYGRNEGRAGVSAPTGSGGPSGMAGFTASPDYQFRLNEAMRGLTARNAALGIQDSGAAQRAAITLAGNQASGEFNNYANRLAALAGVGQTAANTSAQIGQNYANSVGNIAQNNASNLGSSYQQQGANQANLWGTLAGIGGGLVNQYWPTSPTSRGGSLNGLF